MMVPLFLLRGHGPDAFEGEFGFEVGVELVVVREEGGEQFLLGPEPDLEEALGQFLLHVAFEAAPGHEEALWGVELAHGSEQLVHRGAVDGLEFGLHFDTELRSAEAERSHACEDVRAAIGTFGTEVGGVALGFEDAFHQTGEAVSGKLGLNHGGNPVEALLFQIDQIVGQFFIVDLSGLGLGFDQQTLLAGIIAPAAGFHGFDAGFGVVALDAADGEEGSKGMQQVLAEALAGDRLADPLHAAPVVEGIRSFGLKMVVAGDLADVDALLRLERQHHPVALLHRVGKGPDLGGMIDALLKLPSWIDGFQDVDQRRLAIQLVEIVGEMEPGHIDPVLFEKLGFEFAVGACADEPEGHNEKVKKDNSSGMVKQRFIETRGLHGFSCCHHIHHERPL